MAETIKKTLRDSAANRWLVLLLLAFAMFCSYIFMDILSPIKDLMLSERGWDSTAFGTMQGSETFLNVFVFFLIFAGRQDGRAFHSASFGSSNAYWCNYQLVCCDRYVCW